MKAGSPAIGLAASDAGEGLLSVYTATHLGAELGRAEDSPGPVLRLYDAAGDPAVEASVDPSGSSLIIAKQGEPGAVMSVSGDGKGAFDVLSGADKLASLNGASGTGSLLLQDGAGSLGSWLGVLPGGVGFMELYRGDTRAVQIGPSDTNTNAALRIFGGDNGNVAMGIASNGLPAVRVTDGGGRVLAAMEAVDGSRGAITVQAENGLAAGLGIDQRGEGIVAVYNGTPTPVAFLTTSSGGDGGNVTTALNDGFGVFSAGAAQDGGGEACVNRRTQAGTERLGCLNLGLPSAGMGK
jgi:hypothetical protein